MTTTNNTKPMTTPPTLSWQGEATGFLRMIDQTLLPLQCIEIDCRTVEAVWEAIRTLRVRGAPAIGVAAAYGVVVGMQTAHDADTAGFDRRLDEVCEYLAGSRPTAVNLFWAINRMRQVGQETADLASKQRLERLLEEARTIDREDAAMCAAIGQHGAELLEDGWGVLTHCNAGGLVSTGDGGTALSVIFTAVREGKRLHVYADETRPLLQGARLTAWELVQRQIPATLICDSMAGWVMKEGRIQAVVTGADRIAANGDSANKIGTYSVAHLAKSHGIPFYIAAPSSTFDLSIRTGESIPIEERAREEITEGMGRVIAPAEIDTYNPAFDVTPAELIAAIVTEKGLIRPVTAENVARVIGS